MTHMAHTHQFQWKHFLFILASPVPSTVLGQASRKIIRRTYGNEGAREGGKCFRHDNTCVKVTVNMIMPSAYIYWEPHSPVSVPGVWCVMFHLLLYNNPKVSTVITLILKRLKVTQLIRRFLVGDLEDKSKRFRANLLVVELIRGRLTENN